MSTQLNLPITELITITIATTTYPKKKRGKIEEYLTKDIVSTRDICPRCIFFSEIEMVKINSWQDFLSFCQ